MIRRRTTCQLDLFAAEPGVGAGHGNDEPATPAVEDRWAEARLDVLVRTLHGEHGYSARGLARTLACSPATVAGMRAGRIPRAPLRGRLIRLAWRELGPAEQKVAHLAPRPADNVRWHAGSRFAMAHAHELEPGGRDVPSLCGFQCRREVSAGWPTTPDGFASLCPGCLERYRRMSADDATGHDP